MHRRTRLHAAILAVSILSAAGAASGQTLQAPLPVTTALPLYVRHCSGCHDSGAVERAPGRDALRAFAPEAILAALTNGKMSAQAGPLTDDQKRTMAVYLSGRPFGDPTVGDAARMPNRCTSAAPVARRRVGADWNGWGADLGNSRFQASPGITAADVPKLTLKWAFGFPRTASAYGQPAVVDGRVYAGSDSGYVYALDAETGCVHWSFQARSGVRTGMSVGPLKGGGRRRAVYFGDASANVYALDADTGERLWSDHPEPHPLARITGTPALYDGRLYVPMSSGEESAGGLPNYPCCTFRGSVIAYDAATGKRVWTGYTIPEPPAPTKKTSIGTQLYGPSGAAIWSAVTVDVKRKLLYVATGDGYSAPAEGSSDAVIAFDLKSGRRAWVRQVLKGDVWLTGCAQQANPKSETCPPDMGPDFDFGANPILRRMANGKDVLIAGQKSGIAWGFDPDRNGEILWQQRVGRGSATGGVQFGPAADNDQGYFATSDQFLNKEAGGLTAVSLATGAKVWSIRPGCPTSGTCLPAQSAAVTVIPGVVFSGTLDGVMRAYSTKDGALLWEYNSVREYQTVNGVEGRGGMLNGPGPVVANGMFFMNSGYAAIGGNAPGNVLLAFEPVRPTR
ncbi:MAG: PQQ-binding-like beta-propeller repeat protein [Vicinamibacterales bacterium]